MTRKVELPPDCPVQLDVPDHELMAQVVSYYHQRLKENPTAQSYIVKRGLVSSEMAEHFKLGFSDRTLGLRLPENNRRAGKEIRGRLSTLGILRESGHEHFAGSITFPLFDLNGQVGQIYGRKTTPNLRPGTALHLHLPGVRRIFNAKVLKVAKTVIITDSVINALTLWVAEMRNVVAVLGDFTEEHLAAFKANGTENVLTVCRNTEAGNKLSEELMVKLTAIGIAVEGIHLPAGMDVSDYALSHPPAVESLSKLLGVVNLGLADPPAPKKAPAPSVLTLVPTVSPSVPTAAPAALPSEAISEKRGGNELVIEIGDRRYRVRGLDRNLSSAVLKVNLLVSRAGLAGTVYYVDTLDLYVSKQRAAFTSPAAVELGLGEDIIKRDLGQVLLQLEQAQEELMRNALEPKVPTVTLTEQETTAAVEFLKSPNLLEQILTDFERCGLVGESDNKAVAYLAAVSRKLDDPLAIIIQSTSAAGKSSLMDAVLAFVPEEDRQEFSAMTGQSLFYIGESGLAHKVLAIAEQEGAARASYAMKLLQSEGELTIASTSKNTDGRLVAEQYKVKGPIALFTSTTAVEIDAELQNE